MVPHELYEFEKLKPQEEDVCLKALKKELGKVPLIDLEEYILFRTEVFESLVDYLHKRQESLEEEARKSLKYLRGLQN